MTNDLPDCCGPKKEYKGDSPLRGLLYGLIPHTGCILFIVAAILGSTILMQFFRPLLMNRYIFHYLILISIGFASVSSFIYLRKHKCLSLEGIKSKKGYLTVMYGSTVGINLILFILIFPMLANITGNVSAEDVGGLAMLEISVDIPCPGHAPLISNEVKTVYGVEGSDYSFPNNFKVYYDSSKTSKKKILALEVFDEYPAEVLSEEVGTSYGVTPTASLGSCSGGCGGPGTCGGSCGSPSCGR
jgi:hypothetical protein